jgi:hypothetical protein
MVESIKNMTMPLGERLAKIDKNIASVRLDKNKFFDLIVDAGYVTEDGSADIKKFNRAANRAGIDVSDRSQKNLQRITKFLNEKSGGSYKNVGRFSAKAIAENAASQSKGFLGEYAEQYSAATKEEFWNDAKKLQRKVNKEKISSLDKVKKIARGLKNKWAVPIGVTTTLLSKMGFGKALSAVGGPPGMVAGIALDAPMLVDAAKTVKEDGIMNMDEMIRPIGMAAGGPIPPEEPKIKPKEKPVNFKAIMAEFDTPENKAGPGEPTGIEKIIADEFVVDPRFTMKQRVKEMLGMGGDQGSSNFADQLELEIIKLESTIKSLMADEVLTGTDNSRAIQGNQNLLEYYRSLR